ncbi:DUF3231 family protein [Priestia endophytica]|jgi:hypothetical protein|uniref:DUF3231 family protein n=1 Tax=Priestia endophytica TaxID=135735 RepID=UPI00203CA59D|nr:DUF3231 family protein [Priestia endophytica]MCM3538731.1 DUF3231 family protein [Priestia endophytica]
MEEQGKQIRLTAGEIAPLWTQYMNDTSSICMLTYFLEKAEDVEIKPIIEYALEQSQAHIQKITAILTEEKNKIPHGFKLEEDVDLTAPRLFSDGFALSFIHQMAKIGLTGYSASLSSSTRSDITSYYEECVTDTMQLYKRSKDLLLSKGLYVRAPYFPKLEQADFVKKQSFLWDIFGEKRSLTAMEVTNLYSNIQRNALGSALLVGFSQVAKSKEVTHFLLRGSDIAKKNIKILGEKLAESNLPISSTWDADITKSTTHTFSEKLMMFYTSALIALGVGYYGTAIAESPRVDLGAMYNRLTVETQKYAEDGSNIMIKNGWLEQPPMAPDRKELAKG